MSKTIFGALPTPEDIRAARAWLGWTQADLGGHVGLSSVAIVNIEKKKFNPTAANLQKIQEAFFDSDIEFLPGGGFKKRSDLVRVFEGDEGIRLFYDDVASTAEREGGEFLVYGVDEGKFTEASTRVGISQSYRNRMKRVKDISFRVLIAESDQNQYSASHCEYRRLPDELIFTDAPFYIYGDRLALIVWRDTPKFIIISDNDLTEAYRRQFDFLWKNAVEG